MKVPLPTAGQFIITAFVFILSLSILASILEIRFDSLLNFGGCTVSKAPLFSQNSSLSNSHEENSSSSDVIRILLGIPTLPDQYHRRHFIRLIYDTQSLVGAKVDVRFVFCNLTKEDQKVLVALEIMRYNDIMILNCTENMDEGKTYTYFSSLPKILNEENKPYPPYHYVLKGDDDTYFRLAKLVESLRVLPRDDLYYGALIPCKSKDTFKGYMSGMGYLVSWDIVEWISVSDIPKSNLKGPEDKLFNQWLNDGHRAKNRFNAEWSMYNYPKSGPYPWCAHDFWPNTIAVHLLKSRSRWIRTLKYFDVTKNLKPSKLYHIP